MQPVRLLAPEEIFSVTLIGLVVRSHRRGREMWKAGSVQSSASDVVTGGLGVLITVLEGMLQLNQYQQNLDCVPFNL